MKKRINFILALLLLTSIGAFAQAEEPTAISFEYKNGEVVTIPLLENPKVTFKGNYILIQAAQAKVAKFADVRKCYFSDDPNAVVDANATAEEIEAAYNSISLSNFAPGTIVRIYNVNGMIVKRATVDATGSLTLNYNDLPFGNYIVKAGKTTFKLGKR